MAWEGHHGHGEVEGWCGVCHTTLCLPNFDSLRAPRERIRFREFEYSRNAHFSIREYLHKSAWGSAGWRGLPPKVAPWDIATAARCAAHAFRAHRGVRFARYATRRRTHKAPIQPSKAYQSPHNNPITHGSRWGKPPAPPAFIHVPRRVGRSPLAEGA